MSWEELSKLTKEEIIECAKELKNGWQEEVYDKNRILNDRFELQRKINKAIEILKDTSVDMPSTLLMETIDYARHILGDKD